MVLGVILARLLLPKEFGVYGVALGIVTMAEIFGSGGMLQALVQRKTLTPEDEAAGAALQLGVMLLLGGGLVWMGPVVEEFFQMPGLGLVLQLQSVLLLLQALKLIPASRLRRRLAFERLAIIDVSTQILGGIISIILAIQGYGVLALVIGAIIAGACHTGLMWASAPGSIPLRFRMQSVRALLGYGIGVLLIRICNDFARRVDVLIIGHRLGAELVGLYQRSFQLVSLPLYQFTNTVNQVLLPAMAQVQDEDRRFQRGYLGAVTVSGMMAFPVLTLMWTTGDILIPLLYGPQWSEAVPVLTALTFVGYLRVINNPNGLVTQARARVMAEAVRQAAFAVLTAILVFLGTCFGIQGVILGIGLASLLFLVLMTRLALAVSKTKFIWWLNALHPTLISSTAMGVVVLGLKTILARHMSTLPLLVTISCGGFSVYCLSLRGLLTGEQRRIMERVITMFPSRLQGVLNFCLGSTRVHPLNKAATPDHIS
jgi:PST family polysaccharide transporter